MNPIQAFADEFGTWWIGDTPLTRVHWPSRCTGQVCVIHNPTLHRLSSWPMLWREDRGLVERVCRHGVGHPDPDQFEFWLSHNRAAEIVHGCDGCCAGPNWAPAEP